MDPRTAAKVTAPDLLAAFRADTQDAGGSDEPAMRVWLVLFHLGTGVSSMACFAAAELTVALDTLRSHVTKGEGYSAVLVMSAKEPAMYADARQDISQIAQ